MLSFFVALINFAHADLPAQVLFVAPKRGWVALLAERDGRLNLYDCSVSKHQLKAGLDFSRADALDHCSAQSTGLPDSARNRASFVREFEEILREQAMEIPDLHQIRRTTLKWAATTAGLNAVLQSFVTWGSFRRGAVPGKVFGQILLTTSVATGGALALLVHHQGLKYARARHSLGPDQLSIRTDPAEGPIVLKMDHTASRFLRVYLDEAVRRLRSTSPLP